MPLDYSKFVFWGLTGEWLLKLLKAAALVLYRRKMKKRPQLAKGAAAGRMLSPCPHPLVLTGTCVNCQREVF